MSTDQESIRANAPVRVLQIIDTLGGGGSERLLWDIVRLSNPSRMQHRVVTFFPDGYIGPFVYGERLLNLGAYGHGPQKPKRDFPGKDESVGPFDNRLTTSVVSDTDSPPPSDGSIKRPGKSVGRTVTKSPGRLKKYVRGAALYAPATQRIMSEYFRFRPGLVNVHGFYGFSYGVFLKRVFGCPLAVTVPAMFSQMIEQGTGWLIDYYRRFHYLVDAFFLNPGYRHELIALGVPVEKLFDFGATLDLEAIERVKAERLRYRREVRARLGIPEDSLIALSVGRLDPTKGHSYALEALPVILEELPNLHWVVLGEGWKREELTGRISALGVGPHAHLIGFEPEPLQFYAAADIYLRTTTLEGENISSLQAIGMGLPVAGFDTCRETDLVKPLGQGLLVPNMNVSALAAAVIQILSLPDRGQAMGNSGIDYCRVRLNLRNQVDQIASVYAAMAEAGSKI